MAEFSSPTRNNFAWQFFRINFFQTRCRNLKRKRLRTCYSLHIARFFTEHSIVVATEFQKAYVARQLETEINYRTRNPRKISKNQCQISRSRAREYSKNNRKTARKFRKLLERASDGVRRSSDHRRGKN